MTESRPSLRSIIHDVAMDDLTCVPPDLKPYFDAVVAGSQVPAGLGGVPTILSELDKMFDLMKLTPIFNLNIICRFVNKILGEIVFGDRLGALDELRSRVSKRVEATYSGELKSYIDWREFRYGRDKYEKLFNIYFCLSYRPRFGSLEWKANRKKLLGICKKDIKEMGLGHGLGNENPYHFSSVVELLDFIFNDRYSLSST